MTRDGYKPVAGLLQLVIRLGLVFSLAVFAACSGPDSGQDLPELLRVGLVPGESAAILRQRHTPLLDHLSQKQGFDYELVIPDSYAGLVDGFASGDIDMAYFGGFTFIRAHEQSGAVPLVIRDTDTRFTSYIITRPALYDSIRASTNEEDFLQGKSLCFGSKLSTSGHLMPRYFLKEMDIEPAQHFSEIIYTGSHEKTATAVSLGDCDVGAINSYSLDQMFANEQISNWAVRVIWESPPYPDYVWSVQQTFKPSVIRQLRDAFLELSPANPEERKLFNGANGFLPIAVEDFRQLSEIANSAEMQAISSDL